LRTAAGRSRRRAADSPVGLSSFRALEARAYNGAAIAARAILAGFVNCDPRRGLRPPSCRPIVFAPRLVEVGWKMVQAGMASPKEATANAIAHPFVVKLNCYIRLDSDDIAALGEALDRRVAVKKGKGLIAEGYESKGLHIVESGFAVRYKLLHNGGRQIVNIVLPGDIIGFPASFFDEAAFSVGAITRMTLNYIPLERFASLCLRRANIATALVWFAAREAALYAEHIIDAGRRAPLERLAHFLLETHVRLRAVGCASERSFKMPLSQESIGDTVGLSGPHVNRMLAELKSEGLIAMSGSEVTILDRAALQILGEFRSSYLERVAIPGHDDGRATAL
jgi:CRP-like cAMP-binding protein